MHSDRFPMHVSSTYTSLLSYIVELSSLYTNYWFCQGRKKSCVLLLKIFSTECDCKYGSNNFTMNSIFLFVHDRAYTQLSYV